MVPPISYRHGANNPKFRKLHQTQAYIGSSQLCQGHLLVKDWHFLQEEFLEEIQAELKLDYRYYMDNIWA
jgi:hypothetical protein